MQRELHPVESSAIAGDASSAAAVKRGKKRGNYNCGRCGQPKKGHTCHVPLDPTAAVAANDSDAASSGAPQTVRRTPLWDAANHSVPRRALSFRDEREEVEGRRMVLWGGEEEEEEVEEGGLEGGSGRLPWNCIVEVLRRLAPTALMSAAQVCRGWRDCSRRLWCAAEELRMRVPARSHLGFVGSVLQKCPDLVRLSLQIESNLDATILACIAFSCPNLEALEIQTADTAINRLTGDELSRFVAEKKCLSSLKIEGCNNLGSLNVCSLSLSTLWLSDLHSISKPVINCPNLKELSLDFSRQKNDSTDLISMVDSLGRNSPRLRNVHIASARLSNDVVLALANQNLRYLRMLSLVLGADITDASIVAITSSYSNLELLDLSGSSVTDSGIGMICNVFPETLSRLFLALCPNITSSGIQFATAQLPFLRLFDCGKTICDSSASDLDLEEDNPGINHDPKRQQRHSKKLQPMYQKLIIKHGRLRKLSLWGCSGLDALYLNCPELNDLNLSSCKNLHPDRLLLQCPSLESVHASGCGDALVGAIQDQVCNAFGDEQFPSKRLADGSKRVKVPYFLCRQPLDDTKRRKTWRPKCTIHTN